MEQTHGRRIISSESPKSREECYCPKQADDLSCVFKHGRHENLYTATLICNGISKRAPASFVLLLALLSLVENWLRRLGTIVNPHTIFVALRRFEPIRASMGGEVRGVIRNSKTPTAITMREAGN